MSKTIKINEKDFILEKDFNGGFNNEEVEKGLTEYFDDYDYIVGDWSYGKLRLKGFNLKENKKFNSLNDYSLIDNYIEKY